MEHASFEKWGPNFKYTRNMDIVKRRNMDKTFHKGIDELEGRMVSRKLDRDQKVADLSLDLSRQQRLLSPPNGTIIRQLERSRRTFMTNTSPNYPRTDLSNINSDGAGFKGGPANISGYHSKLKKLPNMHSSMMDRTFSLPQKELNQKDSTMASPLADGFHWTTTDVDFLPNRANRDSSSKFDRNAGTISRTSMRTNQNGGKLKPGHDDHAPPNAPSKRKPPWHVGNSFPPSRVIHKSVRNSNLNSMFPRVDGVNWGRSCPTQIYATFRLWQAQQLRANGTIHLDQIWNRQSRAFQSYDETPEGYPSTPYGWYSRNTTPTEGRLLDDYAQTTGIM